MQQESSGVQIFLEIIDHDITGVGQDELIDRFAINVTIHVGTNMTGVYSGIFGFAEINATFRLICAGDYYGPRCTYSSLYDNGVHNCDTEYTGELCATSKNDCIHAKCGQNKMCVDGRNRFTCVCAPGYTGLDCLTDIDECAGVDCNSGTCVQGVAFFTCVCPPRYTGKFCERRLDAYELKVTIDRVRNPEGRCADYRGCSGCCEGVCPQVNCDYYLSHCQRPIGTPVSYVPARFQGRCAATQTLNEQHNTTGGFSFVFSTLTLRGSEWVSCMHACMLQSPLIERVILCHHPRITLDLCRGWCCF